MTAVFQLVHQLALSSAGHAEPGPPKAPVEPVVESLQWVGRVSNPTKFTRPAPF